MKHLVGTLLFFLLATIKNLIGFVVLDMNIKHQLLAESIKKVVAQFAPT